MSNKCIDVELLYAKDSNLKREDVSILQGWIKKEPHLPEITDTQAALFLHSNYYRIEAAKTTIEKYFSVRTHCPEVFDCLDEESTTTTLSVGLCAVLPQRTPEDYSILLCKLLDFKVDNFNFVNLLKVSMMVTTLYVHQQGFANGAIIVFDVGGTSLGHIARINLSAFKYAIYFMQEAAPVRLKGIHVINVTSAVEKIFAMVKPLLHKELHDMIHFHPSPDSGLYEHVPLECLPKDYGGAQVSVETLHSDTKQNLIGHLDVFKWHQNQKVDESKRFGKPKNLGSIFGAEGTFKKLELD